MRLPFSNHARGAAWQSSSVSSSCSRMSRLRYSSNQEPSVLGGPKYAAFEIEPGEELQGRPKDVAQDSAIT